MRCDLLGPYHNFSYFHENYYIGTGYGFFSSMAAHDWQILTIASICSPDKEIRYGLP
jgi:hypothetical protein